MLRVWVWAWVLLASGCGEDAGRVELLVDLKTDLVPGAEFAAVVTEVTVPRRHVANEPAFEGASYVHGRRVAELGDVDLGPTTFTVTLTDAAGDAVVSRPVSLNIRESIAVTVVITRDCRGVVCPAASDGPDQTACFGGACVDPMCLVETPEQCITECTDDAECSSAYPCAVPRCIDGACLVEPDDAMCSSEAICSPELGCVVIFDGGVTGCGTDVDCAPTASCDDPATCQGSRADASCVDRSCVPATPVDDDSACDDATMALDCGLYQPVLCSGAADQTAPSCPTSCTDDAECVAAAHCDGTCTMDLGPGTACTRVGECAEGLSCVEGVCCSSDCTAECASCAVAGSEGTCTPLGAGAECRPAAGACDVAEVCNGTDDTCPADGFTATGTKCRAAGGTCDIPEQCTGVTPDCPPDTLVPMGFACRPSIGPCDRAEECSGADPACPADGLEPSTTTCRPTAGACDVAESCTGSSAACPADGYLPSTTTCRPVAGPCDIGENCRGDSPSCPADGFAARGTICRASIGRWGGRCNPAETCGGGSAACPADTRLYGCCRISCSGCSGCSIAGNCPATGNRGWCSATDQSGRTCSGTCCITNACAF